jgi:hypothetical protein
MVDELQRAIRQARSGRRWNAIEEKPLVQRVRRIALKGNQGKPTSALASIVLVQAMPKLYRAPKIAGLGESVKKYQYQSIDGNRLAHLP